MLKKIKEKYLMLVLILIISSQAFYAQMNQTVPIRQRLIFGGDFGLAIGTNSYINISPIVGYRITPRFSAGLGPIYIYSNEQLTYIDTIINQTIYYDYYSISSNTYGGKVFLSYDLLQNMEEYLPINLGKIILYAENELLNVELFQLNQSTQKLENTGKRKWIDSVLVGGGISFPLGSRSAINLLLLWNLNESVDSPYTNPIMRISFNF